MRIVVPRETAPGERRVALVPESCKKLIQAGYEIYLYLSDCDAVYRQALAVGATSVQEPKTQFYGDRHGCVRDSCGNLWWMATHVEDVAPDELERRAKAARPVTLA